MGVAEEKISGRNGADSTGQVLEEIVLMRCFGANAVGQIVTLASVDSYASLLELISNSYDADATKVELTVDFEKDFAILQDNGLGMTPEDLKSFYRLGDSPKLNSPISPGGRRRIGKFGFATILLNELAGEYTLQTCKDDLFTTVYEKFDIPLEHGKVIPFEVKNVSSISSRTIITLNDLKFKEGENFDMKRLYRAIQWGLPHLPDFKVYINGNLVESKSILHSREFQIDETGKHMGHVTGTIYLTNSASQMAGMHVYVNGRRVGDPKEIVDIGDISMSLVNRLVGIFEADSLEAAILFDRSRFKEDHPGYLELKKTLVKAGLAIRRYADGARHNNITDKLQREAPKLLDKVKARLLSVGMPGVTDSTSFEFSDAISEDILGVYDPGKNSLSLNSGHPRIVVSEAFNKAQYVMVLLGVVVDTIARSKSCDLEQFVNERDAIWSRINKDQKAPKQMLHPNARYTVGELVQYSGVSLGSIRYMMAGGLLTQNDSEQITGNEFQNVLKMTAGMISLYQFAAILGISRMQGTTFERLNQIIKDAESASEPFVRNFGDASSPCYFVDGACVKRLIDSVKSSPFMTMRTVYYRPKAAFDELRNSFYTLPVLAQTTELDVPTIAGVIQYAKTHSHHMNQKVVGGAVKFNFADFLTALQYQRGNINGKCARS